MMLYPHNSDGELSRERFRDPGCEYRGTPFWAWNGKLDDQTLGWQIDMLAQMGLAHAKDVKPMLKLAYFAIIPGTFLAIAVGSFLL